MTTNKDIEQALLKCARAIVGGGGVVANSVSAQELETLEMTLFEAFHQVIRVAELLENRKLASKLSKQYMSPKTAAEKQGGGQ